MLLPAAAPVGQDRCSSSAVVRMHYGDKVRNDQDMGVRH